MSLYTPPWKPASGIVLLNGENSLDGDQSCNCTADLSPILSDDVPPFKTRPKWIVRWHHADSFRRRERLWDMALLISLQSLEVCFQEIMLSI